MAKSNERYRCQSCGSEHRKWSGKCDGCGGWNTIVTESIQRSPYGDPGSRLGAPQHISTLSSVSSPPERLSTFNAEFDRALGGGLVAGSTLLIGGDPGIGKSTLLLQIAAQLAGTKNTINPSQPDTVLYCSGEESEDQIRLRAIRLGHHQSQVGLVTASNLLDIMATLVQLSSLKLVVIDSIQTVFDPGIDSAPGTVTQIRSCAHRLSELARDQGFCLILVGHVTKEGWIAGPKVLEHMVDTVLYFEGDRGHHFRMIRSIKNRFGPANEIGVFEMTPQGLAEVSNPSSLFLNPEPNMSSGAVVYAGVEGSRPILIEIQALVGPTSYSTPKRAVVGWDANRLSMILAVLEARCGLSLSQRDVFLNVAGGYKIQETAADLPAAAAVLSSLHHVGLKTRTVMFGEIGLSGEIRPVGQTDLRLREAAKLGFEGAIYGKTWGSSKKEPIPKGLTCKTLGHLDDMIQYYLNKHDLSKPDVNGPERMIA